MKNKYLDKYKAYVQRLEKETAIYAYLDLANMFHWQEVLGWTFRLEDAISQIISIKSVKEIKVYYGKPQATRKGRGFAKTHSESRSDLADETC